MLRGALLVLSPSSLEALLRRGVVVAAGAGHRRRHVQGQRGCVGVLGSGFERAFDLTWAVWARISPVLLALLSFFL
jgi:hypothetical protein